MTRWHRLGSALATAWFLTLIAYVFPWDELDAKRPEPVTFVVQHAQMYQSWRMFRSPSKWDRFLVHEGLGADGEWAEIVPDTRPPDGSFLITDYGRWRKVQFAMSADSKYLPGYADWVCEQSEVSAIRLSHLKRRKRTVKTARSGEARPEKRTVIHEQLCP